MNISFFNMTYFPQYANHPFPDSQTFLHNMSDIIHSHYNQIAGISISKYQLG